MSRALLLGLVACTGPDPVTPPTDDPLPDPVPGALAVDWAPSPLVEAVWTASWTPPGPGDAVLEVALDDGDARVLPAGEGTFALIGAKAGRTYTAQVVHTGPDGARWESEAATLVVPEAPVPSLDVRVADAARMEAEERWVLAAVAGSPSHVVIYDRDGDPVWWRAEAEQGVLAVAAGLDGRSVVHAEFESLSPTGPRPLVRTALDGSSEQRTDVALAHHDFAELPGGGFAALVLSLGATTNDAGDPVVVQSTAVVEVAEGAVADDPPDVVFDLLADYVDPWPACEHVVGDSPGLWRWDHSNSLVYDEVRDVYWVLARNLDALLVIDRATGTLLHQVGGRDATIGLDDPFDHGHFSWRAPGRVLVFDNGLHRTGGSRVVEIAVDLDAGTAATVWSLAEPDGRTMPVLSDADGLPGGNVLVTWTALGTLTEVTPDGAVVWEATTEGGTPLLRVEAVADPAVGL